jgi:hypothetical protein
MSDTRSLYCRECNNYLMSGDGECHDCVCGWKQPVELDSFPDKAILDSINRSTVDWTLRAARGECGWVCADCCQSFPYGMPDKCIYGHEDCTDIITRDKIAAHSHITEDNK